MYIDPFVAGILVTILVECLSLVIYGIANARGGKRK